MRKLLKSGLVAFALVLALLGTFVTYVAATFNPNDYKGRIEQAIKDSSHRTLHLDGDLKMSFFPDIGIDTGHMSLSELNSDQQFAAIDSARVSLAFFPLLNHRIVISKISLNGLQATLVKNRDGTMNIDDLLSMQPSPYTTMPVIEFDVLKASMSNARFAYIDAMQSIQYQIGNFNLSAGRIETGVPTKLIMNCIVQSDQPKVNASMNLQTTLKFDFQKHRYAVAGLEMKVAGDALNMTRTQVVISGDASADLVSQEFTAHKFQVKVNGMRDGHAFSVNLGVPDLNLTKDQYDGSKLTLDAKLNSAFGKLNASLMVPTINGTMQAFTVENVTMDAQLVQARQNIGIRLTSPLAGDMVSQQLDLSNLGITINASGNDLPNKQINSTMKGNMHLDLRHQAMLANLYGGILQSQIRAKVLVNGLFQPSLHYEAVVDQFNADMFLSGYAANQDAIAKPNQPLDFSILNALNMDGKLSIGALKLFNINFNQLNLVMKLHQGVLDINPVTAKLYQGSLNGSLHIDASTIPNITIQQNLTGIEIATLAHDAANTDILKGKGAVSFDLSTQGKTRRELIQALGGTAVLKLSNGTIKGIDLLGRLRNSNVASRSITQIPSDLTQQTDFSDLLANFRFGSGVAHNTEMILKSPLLHITGTGDIDLAGDTVDYLVKASYVKSPNERGRRYVSFGLAVPVHISGPINAMKFSIDGNAMNHDNDSMQVKTSLAKGRQKKAVVKRQGMAKINRLSK